MGDDAENVTLVTMSEFGRTARQNGTGGTDHGHANAMFVLGGQSRAARSTAAGPASPTSSSTKAATSPSPPTFRQVLGEAVAKTIGANNLELVFPGAKLQPDRFLRLIYGAPFIRVVSSRDEWEVRRPLRASREHLPHCR
jgi:uncharacterized protein (DUF1501 family)